MRRCRVEITAGAAVVFPTLFYLDDSGVFSAVLPAVFFHEIGHCISARMYGGRILSLRISLSGLCLDTVSAFRGGVRSGRAGMRSAVGGALLANPRRMVGAVPGCISVLFRVQSASGAAARRRTDPPCALQESQSRSNRYGVYRGDMPCVGGAHTPLGVRTSGGMHPRSAAQSITARRFSMARRSKRDTCT